MNIFYNLFFMLQAVQQAMIAVGCEESVINISEQQGSTHAVYSV